MSTELVKPSNHLILCHHFSFSLQSFPASGSFLMSQLFTSGGQSIGVSASASVFPMPSSSLKGILFPTVTIWKHIKSKYTEFENFLSTLQLNGRTLYMCNHHIWFCCPLLLLPSIFPSIRVFSNELALCIKWPGCWSFNFSISPSNEYSRLNRIDWFDLLVYKGLWRVFLNTTVWKHQFFGTQLSLRSNSHIWTWLLEKP